MSKGNLEIHYCLIRSTKDKSIAFLFIQPKNIILKEKRTKFVHGKIQQHGVNIHIKPKCKWIDA